MITTSFDSKTTAAQIIAGHDLTGKTALITGGASGIGLETTRALLSAHAEVIVAMRGSGQAFATVTQLRESTGNQQVSLVELDLASLESIRRAAEEITSRWPQIHLLLNNAGIMAVPMSRTADGFESQFGTNHLGHYLLTNLILPSLLSAAPARIVVLSSSGHRHSGVHFEDLNYERRPYDKWQAYGQSKTADALFAVELTTRFADQGVTANAVNPGGTHTRLQDHLSREDKLALGWIDKDGHDTSNFKSAEQGAATSIWAAVGAELEGVGGKYLEDCQEAIVLSNDAQFPGHGCRAYALDPDDAERLWTVSRDLTGLKG